MKAATCIFLCIACCLPTAYVSAQGMPWQGLEIVGKADLNFLFWPVYKASLYSSTEAFEFPRTRPFALALEYRRAFARQQLVTETQRQWQAAGVEPRPGWLEKLQDIFVDVNKGDVITLFVSSEGHSHFYLNMQLLGSIEEPAFTEQFAGIWLADTTTRPEFRASLLGAR